MTWDGQEAVRLTLTIEVGIGVDKAIQPSEDSTFRLLEASMATLEFETHDAVKLTGPEAGKRAVKSLQDAMEFRSKLSGVGGEYAEALSRKDFESCTELLPHQVKIVLAKLGGLQSYYAKTWGSIDGRMVKVLMERGEKAVAEEDGFVTQEIWLHTLFGDVATHFAVVVSEQAVVFGDPEKGMIYATPSLFVSDEILNAGFKKWAHEVGKKKTRVQSFSEKEFDEFMTRLTSTAFQLP